MIDGEVHDRYFAKGEVRAHHLLERFQEGDFTKEGDVEKMVLVYFVENILYG